MSYDGCTVSMWRHSLSCLRHTLGWRRGPERHENRQHQASGSFCTFLSSQRERVGFRSISEFGLQFFEMSCSYWYHVLAQLDFFRERVATRHLPALGAANTVYAQEHTDYFGVKLKALFFAFRVRLFLVLSR